MEVSILPLKPCPFCGSEKVQARYMRESFYIVRCDDCRASSGAANGPRGIKEGDPRMWSNYGYWRAVERWNQRAEVRRETQETEEENEQRGG